MNFTPLISTCKCAQCGEISSCARNNNDKQVCRGCNPEWWEVAAEIEKDLWLNGSVEKTSG